MINVEVEKNGNENSTALLRRFTKRVQGSGVLSRVRGNRYAIRKPSKYVKKKKTLNNIARKTEIQKLIKLGKMSENQTRGKKR